MNKSAQLRDFSQAKWPERRKSLTQQGPLSAVSAAAALRASQFVEISRASTSTGPPCRSVGRVAIDNDRKAKLRTYPRIKTRYPPVYVKLAEENAPAEQSDSDSCAYDSSNEAETDFCKDESDYSDDYETDGFATMDVFEYEVDELSDSEDLESCGSSGTDDMVAEVVARAIFATSSDSDTDFGIFNMDADTEPEGSDVPSDPELGRADYWTCVKCKNQKNNPMYRFCEKCYQIRKTHFPPRPKHRRKRANSKNRNAGKTFGENFSSPSSRSSASSTNLGKHGDDSDISDDQLGNQFKKESKQMRLQRRRSTTSLKQNHNSAGESSCCSSQEQSPDEQQSTLSTQYLRAACASSQNTYCSKNEPIIYKQNPNLNLFERNLPNSQETTYPISESSSQPSILGKCDSQLSTISDFSMDLTSSDSFLKCHEIKECDANGNKCNNLTATIQKCDSTDSIGLNCGPTTTTTTTTTTVRTEQMTVAESIAANKNITKKTKKRKIDFSDEADNSDINDDSLMTKKFRAEDETDTSNGMCMICLTEPKNGAFVHNRFLHVCACYRCTVKVWNKRKRCPICNSQVKTVLKMFVH